MIRVPQFASALALLALTVPMLAASPEGRSTEFSPLVAGMDIVPLINMLPAAPTAMLKIEAAVPRAVLRQWETLDLPNLATAQSSVVSELPMVGAVRRRAGERFNTTDSSHPNDFALCYRLTPRMGLQVIPGDPTPANVKLPVSTMANNAGVTVGMTLRLGRSR